MVNTFQWRSDLHFPMERYPRKKKFSVEIWDANDYLESSKHRDRDTENGSEHDFDGNIIKPLIIVNFNHSKAKNFFNVL